MHAAFAATQFLRLLSCCCCHSLVDVLSKLMIYIACWLIIMALSGHYLLE